MNFDFLIARLAANGPVLESLARGVGPEQARWKPAPDKWSILEVVNHLYDEEREDFRARLDGLLHRPDEPLAPIDPPRWAIERRYNERELAESLERFLAERRNSLQWLERLSSPNWENGLDQGARFLRAGDVMASWVAHDLLHIRQLAKLHWLYTGRAAVPFLTAYAGEW